MIDVLIITHNESLNLPHCLSSLAGWTRKIFVVDSGSTDGTQEVARSFGAEVVHHDWEGYARQKNWGLRNLPFESEWILIVDADEVITEQLKPKLQEIAQRPTNEVPENGFFINRLTYFMGRPIRHCGFFPSWNLRFFKRGKGRYEDREVHEHVIVPDPVGYIRVPMLHDDRRGLEHYFAKHNRYSTLEARALFEELRGARSADDEANITADTRRRRWLKRNVMPHVPFPGFWRFMYMYVLQFGVLDRRAGFEFCRFIAMYDSMVALKLRELRRIAKGDRAGKSVAPAAPARGLARAEGAEMIAPASVTYNGAAMTPVSQPSPSGRGQRVGGSEAQATLEDALAPNPSPGGRGAISEPPVQMQPEASPWTFREKVGRAVWMLVGRPIFRLSFHNWYAFRAAILRLFGATIGKGVAVRPTVNIEVPWMIEIADDATVGDHAILYSLGKISIGKRSIVSQYAHLCAGTHDYTDHTFKLIRSPISIGDDVWVGADAFIGPGVRIDSLSVVGARSSVYKDAGPRQVFVGNPAKPIKERVLR